MLVAVVIDHYSHRNYIEYNFIAKLRVPMVKTYDENAFTTKYIFWFSINQWHLKCGALFRSLKTYHTALSIG